jgi:hypothetical protein
MIAKSQTRKVVALNSMANGRTNDTFGGIVEGRSLR